MDFAITENTFSLNLISGYSAGNTFIEVGVFSNHNQFKVRGAQFAGLFNVTGKKIENSSKRKNADYLGNVNAFQLAGLGNKVMGDGGGFQTAGLFNYVNKTFLGGQVGGFLNGILRMAH